MSEQPATGAEESRIASIDEMRAEQDRQGNLIDEILGLLKGGSRTVPDDSGRTTQADPPPAPDIAQQVRQAVRDVAAETAAGTGEPRPEQPPKEAGQPTRQRIQGFMFGKDK